MDAADWGDVLGAIMKICSRCQRRKKSREFGVDRGMSDHLASHCRECRKKRQRERRALAKEQSDVESQTTLDD